MVYVAGAPGIGRRTGIEDFLMADEREATEVGKPTNPVPMQPAPLCLFAGFGVALAYALAATPWKPNLP